MKRVLLSIAIMVASIGAAFAQTPKVSSSSAVNEATPVKAEAPIKDGALIPYSPEYIAVNRGSFIDNYLGADASAKIHGYGNGYWINGEIDQLACRGLHRESRNYYTKSNFVDSLDEIII